MTEHIGRYIAMTTLLIGLMNTHRAVEAVPVSTNSCCNLVEQALKDVSAIHAGSKRADVEQTFTESAGVSFGSQTVYVYKKCHYIKMSVAYGTTASRSPTDIVSTVSPLSIDYEAKD